MTLTRKSPGRAWIGLAALAVCTLDARTADAQTPDCSTISFVNPIYGTGGSAARPLIGSFAVALRGEADPITIVWSDPGACNAMAALVGPAGTPVNITGTARYWDADGTERQCIHSGAGVAADFGYMAAQPEACVGYSAGLPNTIGNFVGPVTGWQFITHPDSNQSVISAEAAFLAYGFGDESQAAPWDDEAFLLSRSPTSAALLAIAAAITLPPARFLGTDVVTNQAMIAGVSTGTNPITNAATTDYASLLGFVSVEVAQQNRGTVKALAYQHFDQSCGYWADSTPTAFDKRNVRIGKYWLWTNHRFFAPVNPTTGAITNARVARFINAITGVAAPTAQVPNLELIIADGTVPDCAMQVSREEEYGPLASYAPTAPCNCVFDFLATGETTCEECAQDSECPNATDVCRNGYCEAW